MIYHTYLQGGPYNGIITTINIHPNQNADLLRITTRDELSAHAEQEGDPSKTPVEMYQRKEYERMEGMIGHFQAAYYHVGSRESARELIDHVLNFDPRRIG